MYLCPAPFAHAVPSKTSMPSDSMRSLITGSARGASASLREVLERAHPSQFIFDCLKKTLNVQVGVPRDVCGYEDGERVNVERTR